MRINLHEQVFALYDWLETNPLATSCIALWHALVHTAIKAGCPDKFAVAVSVLEAKTGLKRDALYDARNKLQQSGLIKWESRKGNQSAIYQINLFVSDKPTQIPTQNLNNEFVSFKPTQSPTQIATQTPTQIATIIDVVVDDVVVDDVSVDMPNNSQNITHGAKAIALTEEYWKRALDDDEKILILNWCKYFLEKGNEEPDLMIIKALEQSTAARAESKLLYVKAIIECWQEEGVNDLEGIARLNKAHKGLRRASGSSTKPRDKITTIDKYKSGKYESFYL